MDKFKSLSAFAPICNPINVPWGEKALGGYLGDDKEAWKQYDATELVKASKGPYVPMLIDIGTKDDFLYQLSPDVFAAAAIEKGVPLVMRMQVHPRSPFSTLPIVCIIKWLGLLLGSLLLVFSLFYRRATITLTFSSRPLWMSTLSTTQSCSRPEPHDLSDPDFGMNCIPLD
jgi:hypothetical protein